MSFDHELSQLKERFLAKVMEFPELCNRWVLQQLSNQKSSMRFARIAQELSWEFSRQLFEGLSPQQWSQLQDLQESENTAENRDFSVIEDFQSSLKELHCQIPSQQRAVRSWDPFSFLKSMSALELKSFLAPIPTEELALLCAYWTPGELEQYILIHLIPPRKRQMIFQMARAQKLPLEAIQETAIHVADRLQRLKPPPFPHHHVEKRKQEEQKALEAKKALIHQQLMPLKMAFDEETAFQNNILQFLKNESEPTLQALIGN